MTSLRAHANELAGLPRRFRGRHRTLLVIAAACWATRTPVTAAALAERMPVLMLLLVHVAAATAVLWIVVAVRGYRPIPQLRAAVLLGALEPAGNGVLFALALTTVPAATGSLLLSTECMLVVVLGVVVLRERLGPAGWAGLLLCLPGVWLLSGTPTSLSLSVGVLLTFGATSVSAIYSTAIAWLGCNRGGDVLTYTAWQFTIGLLCLLALTAAQYGTTTAAALPGSPATWTLALAGGSLLAVACLSYNLAVSHVAIAEAGIVLNLIPVLGAGLSVIWLGDRLSPQALLGAAITLAGICVLHLRRPSSERLTPAFPMRSAWRPSHAPDTGRLPAPVKRVSS
ncbi:DMT family transporter [Nonomuraea fuscirosea]